MAFTVSRMYVIGGGGIALCPRVKHVIILGSWGHPPLERILSAPGAISGFKMHSIIAFCSCAEFAKYNTLRRMTTRQVLQKQLYRLHCAIPAWAVNPNNKIPRGGVGNALPRPLQETLLLPIQGSP